MIGGTCQKSAFSDFFPTFQTHFLPKTRLDCFIQGLDRQSSSSVCQFKNDTTIFVPCIGKCIGSESQKKKEKDATIENFFDIKSDFFSNSPALLIQSRSYLTAFRFQKPIQYFVIRLLWQHEYSPKFNCFFSSRLSDSCYFQTVGPISSIKLVNQQRFNYRVFIENHPFG